MFWAERLARCPSETGGESEDETRAAPSSPYRMYFLNEEDRIVGVEVVMCDTDEAALRRAADALGQHAGIEVWCGERKIGRAVAGGTAAT